jgi:hypothetical protein
MLRAKTDDSSASQHSPPPQLSAAEVDAVRTENALLKATLEAFGRRHFARTASSGTTASSPPPKNPTLPDDDDEDDVEANSTVVENPPQFEGKWDSNTAQAFGSQVGTSTFYGALKAFVERPEFLRRIDRLRTVEQQQNGHDDGGDKDIDKEETNDAVTTTAAAAAKASYGPDKGSEITQAVNLDGIEWWTVVPTTTTTTTTASSTKTADGGGGDNGGGSDDESIGGGDGDTSSLNASLEIEDTLTTPLTGSYVMVEREDVVEGMAEFVAECLMRMPEAAQLNSTQLQTQLSDTFADLRDKGTIMSLWSWGSYCWSIYGWGTTAFTVYRNPVYARMALKAMWTLSKYACFLVL